MQRPRDPKCMGWSVQEVGIAEGDMLGTGHQMPDIFQDDLLRNGEKPATIDRRNGAMQAVVLATAAGLVSTQVPRAITLQLRSCPEEVAYGGWARKSSRFRKGPASRPCWLTPMSGFRIPASRGFDEGDQRRLKLPADDGIHPMRE